MNRKQLLFISVAVILFIVAGSASALYIKTGADVKVQSTNGTTSSSTEAKQSIKNGVDSQSSSEAPSTAYETNPSTQALNAAPSYSNTPTSPQTPTNSSTQPITETCPDYLKASYNDSYNANVNAENIKYQNNKDSIKAYWNSRGLLYSGSAVQDLAAEDQRHQSALSTLSSNFQQQLADKNCK